MPVSKSAGYRMRGEIGAQPFFLRRTGFAAPDIQAFTVQHDDVPCAEFIAVVAGFWITGGSAEIIEVGRSASGMKLVIASRGAGASFRASPGLVVADEVLLGAVRIRKITDGHNGAGVLIEQFGGGLRTGKILAVGNVARSNQ